MSNSLGRFWRVTTFGESHGSALGAVIDGCPSGVPFDLEYLKKELRRRRPGIEKQVTSDRNETDQPEILSGVFEGKTLGTPIAILVRNADARSGDYNPEISRVGHADDVWRDKYGHSDHRGGGQRARRRRESGAGGAAERH